MSKWLSKGYRPLLGQRVDDGGGTVYDLSEAESNGSGNGNGLSTNGHGLHLGGRAGRTIADRLRRLARRLTAPLFVLVCSLIGWLLFFHSLSPGTQDNIVALFRNPRWHRRPTRPGSPSLWPERNGYYGDFYGVGELRNASRTAAAVKWEEWPAWSADAAARGFGRADTDGGCRFSSPLDALPSEERDLVHRLLAEQEGVAQAGYMFADPERIHPIYSLLWKGEQRWKDMLNRQSTTLEEAVGEYRRRYGRAPPKGFDSWWNWAQENNILLPDEYDTIQDSLAPFWGFSLDERRRRQREAEQLGWTFTLVKHEDGGISSEYVSGHNQFDEWNHAVYGWRAADHIRMIDIMKHLLPVGYRWAMGIADRGAITPSWDEVDALKRAAAEGRALDKDDMGQMSRDDWPYPQWTEACPKTSPLRQGYLETVTPSFAVNLEDSGDVCQHPSIYDEHGLYLEARGPESFPVPHSKLLPIGTLCKTGIQADILTSFTEYGPWNGAWDGVNEDFFDRTPWIDKRPKVFWEGHYTDFDVDRLKGSGRWRHSQRARLHKIGNPTIDHEEPIMSADPATGRPVIEDFSVMDIAEAYYDLRTTPNGHGGSAQCQRLADDGTCYEMEDIFGINEGGHDSEKSREYMYLMDVDGNGWSARFLKLMSSHGLVLKSTIYPEWNAPMYPDWFGFVPIKIDYSDLASVMAFFEGTPGQPDTGRRKVAETMAENGRCWAERTWRIQDVQSYMYRLHLEYARLQNTDKDWDYHLPGTEPEPAGDESGEAAQPEQPLDDTPDPVPAEPPADGEPGLGEK